MLVLLISCATTKSFKASQVSVDFEANATTGYEWTAFIDNSGVYEIVQEHYIPDNNGLVGAGGMYTAILKSIKPGTGSIKFEYKRYWEKSAIKTVIYSIKVDSTGIISINKI